MVKGNNEKGETSSYTYNGLGYLVSNELYITKGAYGYTGSGSGMTTVRKDYVLDYTDPLKRVIMESEAGGQTYRNVYGLEKVSSVITGIQGSAGTMQQTYTYPAGTADVAKLYFHEDRLGSTEYLTDNITGMVRSTASYDEWGQVIAETALSIGTRILDIVQVYTVHPYDVVLGVYFAQARVYDPEGRRFVSVDP
jgi:hypothetical protein